ncbi:MAG: glycosyltransferase [bacterium]
MKIFFLSDGSSIHTRKWVNSLIESGLTIHLFSLSRFNTNDYPSKNFSYTSYDIQRRVSACAGLGKINYLRVLRSLKKEIKEFAPDIVHAHFASSYGLLGALSGFHPFIVSVWGYDIFDFPEKSFIHKMVIKYNLSKADKILSTSNVMAKKTALYTEKEVTVTPFGIDLNVFKKEKVSRKELTPFNDSDVVIGTVKLLEKKYGINYLIEAFSDVSGKHPDIPLKLLIVGGGSEKESLEKMVENLGLKEKVHFTGMVPHNSVQLYHKIIDVFAALSIYDSESFGVAIVEAGACENPVVVSDAGGLPEVVDDGVTGFVVERKNSSATAKELEKLVIDEELRSRMGTAGRKRVEKLYDWKENVLQMLEIYKNIV